PRPHADEVAADPELRPVFEAVERSFRWTTDQLAGTAWLDWLAPVPSEGDDTPPGRTGVPGGHRLPRGGARPRVTPHRPEAELAAAFAGVAADVVLAGHTHQPTDRRIGTIRAVNLGSVSNPVTDDLRASYVIVHAEADRHRIEHRRVAYDRAAVLA